MSLTHVVLQVGGGLTESVAQAAVLAGIFVLALMLVALGVFAYKSLRGDGIRWPSDVEGGDADEKGRGVVTRTTSGTTTDTDGRRPVPMLADPIRTGTGISLFVRPYEDAVHSQALVLERVDTR